MEISIDTLNNIFADMDYMDENDIKIKYNIDIEPIEDIISECTDDEYINNTIYHLVPIVTVSIMILNTIAYCIAY